MLLLHLAAQVSHCEMHFRNTAEAQRRGRTDASVTRPQMSKFAALRNRMSCCSIALLTTCALAGLVTLFDNVQCAHSARLMRVGASSPNAFTAPLELDVRARTMFAQSSKAKCLAYEKLPLIMPNCSDKPTLVPQILHSVSETATQGYTGTSISAGNPSFRNNFHSDVSARAYVLRKCGKIAAEAYSCFVAGAYRADLFRFCAMYADGGVYLDADIVPLYPLEELYSPCAIATVGHDMPQGNQNLQGKQMKILASAPGAPIFKCALDTIVDHVRRRYIPLNSLSLTGPSMLHRCYANHSRGVAVSYIDTRVAVWPFTGMRAGNKVLAFEKPNMKRHYYHFGGAEDDNDYSALFRDGAVYSQSCAL